MTKGFVDVVVICWFMRVLVSGFFWGVRGEVGFFFSLYLFVCCFFWWGGGGDFFSSQKDGKGGMEKKLIC